jgi:hypothetical protein
MNIVNRMHQDSFMPVKIITFCDSNKEAHFPDGNDHVAVCWNIRDVTRTIKGEDGLAYKAQVWERKENKFYIDFITFRRHEGLFVEDEDSPVDGGLSIEFAEKITKELNRAIEYAKSFGKSKKQ